MNRPRCKHFKLTSYSSHKHWHLLIELDLLSLSDCSQQGTPPTHPQRHRLSISLCPSSKRPRLRRLQLNACARGPYAANRKVGTAALLELDRWRGVKGSVGCSHLHLHPRSRSDVHGLIPRWCAPCRCGCLLWSSWRRFVAVTEFRYHSAATPPEAQDTLGKCVMSVLSESNCKRLCCARLLVAITRT